MTRKRTQGWGYNRAGLVAIEDVLPLILDKSVEKAEFHGYKVNVTSLRLQTFAIKGLECSCCGLKATHFAVEEQQGQNNWHLNLWADRSHLGKDEMLITHDHTLARGLGGADHIDNCTTMCRKCNHQKSIDETIKYHELKGLPPPGSAKDKPKKKSAKRQAIAARIEEHNAPLKEIPMELAVRMYQAREARALKKRNQAQPA